MRVLEACEVKAVAGGEGDGWSELQVYWEGLESGEGNQGIVLVDAATGEFMALTFDDDMNMSMNVNGQQINAHMQYDEWGEPQSFYIDGVGSVFMNWDEALESAQAGNPALWLDVWESVTSQIYGNEYF
jgi:hypothetical protein